MSSDGPDRYADKQLDGGWQTQRPIGTGNFAWVYAGVGPDGQKCAIKILHQRSAQAEKRFIREIKIVREIPPNEYCVRYKAHGETSDGAPWMALEFINGVTLSTILAKGQPIRADELTRLMVQVCQGFAGLHRYGLAHRDVKPDNIMITYPEGGVKLLDFGLVQDSQGLLKLFEEQDMVLGMDFAEDLDHGMLAGTPEYMAPEQISDATNASEGLRTDTTADVYSLGVIFFQLLTGRKLFPFTPSAADPKGTQEEVMVYLDERIAFKDEDLARPDEIDAELWSIIAKALHKDPKLRQGTALQLAGHIEVYASTGKGIANDDVSVTVRGLTGIPADVFAATKAAKKKRRRPMLEPEKRELDPLRSTERDEESPASMTSAEEIAAAVPSHVSGEPERKPDGLEASVFGTNDDRSDVVDQARVAAAIAEASQSDEPRQPTQWGLVMVVIAIIVAAIVGVIVGT